MRIQITLNGALQEIDTHPMKRMLDVLREDLGLRGAKEGCGEGECGACAVVMDGRLVDTCLIPAVQMAGCEIRTIEGLGSSSDLDVLQQAFLDEGAVHCGFCTPAMIMAAYALLAHIPRPTDEEVRIGLAGNICRCTGYEKICKAVAKAASAGYGESIKQYENLCTLKTPVFEDYEEERFFAPSSIEVAFGILEKYDDVLIFSGGTDIGPDTKGGRISPTRVMDVFSLPEMNGIEMRTGTGEPYIRIGASATDTDIMESPIAREHMPALVTASSRSGALAMQNRATIGGNIVTASGAGDLPVVLLALGARVLVAGKSGEREVLLDDFVTGYRKTVLQKGELLKEIRVPVPPKGSRQIFYKRGSRKALTLSRASLALYAYCKEGRIVDFRAAAGSMSPVPIRLKRLSAEMPGRELAPGLADAAAAIAYDDVNPRKTPLYRKTMVANLTRRFFDELLKSEGVTTP